MFDSTLALLKVAEPLTTLFAMLTAVLAAYSAYLSYRLTKAIRDEMKSDELLISGVLSHPDLASAWSIYA
jgi:isochorismate hydrolase